MELKQGQIYGVGGYVMGQWGFLWDTFDIEKAREKAKSLLTSYRSTAIFLGGRDHGTTFWYYPIETFHLEAPHA